MDPAGYDQFLGYFSVPAAPKQIPDILYIFTVRRAGVHRSVFSSLRWIVISSMTHQKYLFLALILFYTRVCIAYRPPQGVQNIDWIPKTDPEPTGPFDIVQPVLQSPADSGDDWSIKSWLVTLDVRACFSCR
jgi:hypothetical protein